MSTPLFFHPAASSYEVVLLENRPVKKRNRFSRSLIAFKNWSVKGLMALVVMVFVLLGSLSMPSTANANVFEFNPKEMFCSTAIHFADPEPMNAVLAPNTASKLNPSTSKITVYEKYQGTAPNLTVWIGPEDQKQTDGDGEYAGRQLVNMANGAPGIATWGDGTKPSEHPGYFNENKECGKPMDVGMTAVANFVNNITAYVIGINNAIFQLTFETSNSLISQFDPVIVDVTQTLRDTLYMDFLIPMIMLGALWIGYKGLVQKEFTGAVQGAGWLFAAAAVGLAMLMNPLFVNSAVNKSVSYATEAIMTPIIKLGLGSETAVGNMCSVNEENAVGAVPAATSKLVREVQCTFYVAYMLNSYALQQFGAPLTADPATDKTGAASFTGGDNGIGTVVRPGYDSFNVMLGNVPADKKSWALYQIDATIQYAGADEVDQKQLMAQLAANQTFGKNPNKNWIGANYENRNVIAVNALIGVLALGVMMFAFCLPILMRSIKLVLLAMLLIIFCIIGVHPGFGRRAAIQYLEMIVGLAVQKVVLTALLSLSMIIVLRITTMPIDFFIKLIILIAVVAALIQSKAAIIAMVKIGSGGGAFGRAMESANGGMLAPFQKAGRMAAGGAGAGIAAGRAARSARKSEKVHASASDGAGARKNESHSVADNDNNGSSDNSDAGNGAGASKNTSSHDAQDTAPDNTEKADSPDTGGAGSRRNTQAAEPQTAEPQAPEATDTDGAGPRPKDLPDVEEKIERGSVIVHTKEKRPSIIGATLAGAVAARNAHSVSGAFAAGAGAGRAKVNNITSYNVKRNAQIEDLKKQVDADYKERLRKQSIDKAKRERIQAQAKRAKELAELKKQREAAKAAEKASRERAAPAGRPSIPPRPTNPVGNAGSGAGGRSK